MRLLLVLLLCMLAGCGGGGRASAGDQSLIDQANAMHRAFSPAVISDDPRTRGYMQQISTRLLAAAREVMREQSPGTAEDEWRFSRNIQFHVAKSAIPNAFS